MAAPRRTFLKSLAIAPVALAQTAANPPQPPAPTPAPSPSDAPGPMALALAEAARHRFGAHFAPGDMDEIAKAIQGNLQAADRLHKTPLANWDEPVTQFSALPPAATLKAQPAPRPMPRRK